MELKNLVKLEGEIMNDLNYTQRELLMKSREELAEIILNSQIPKEEMAEKRTSQRSSGREFLADKESKILALMRQYPNLTRDGAERLYYIKLNRRFVNTEDGLSVEKIEEAWI